MPHSLATSPRDAASHVRIQAVETLADDWYVLRKYRFDYRRADGSWQQLSPHGRRSRACDRARCSRYPGTRRWSDRRH